MLITGFGNVNSGAWNTMTMTENQDPQNCFASNTFTAPRTGYYRVTGQLVGSTNGINQGTYSSYYIRCAGTCAFGVSQCYVHYFSGPLGYLSVTEHSASPNFDVYMTAGQTLSLQMYQSAATQLYFHNFSCLTIIEQ